MATLNLADIKKEIEAGIDAATSVADLADHFAKIAEKYGKFVPGAGQEIQAVGRLIDEGDKVLHGLKKALG